jgi:hypothetical protein
MRLRGPMSSPRWPLWLYLAGSAAALAETIRLAWAHDPVGIGVGLVCLVGALALAFAQRCR